MNNCLITVNKDNLVKSCAMLNSLIRAANELTNVYALCTDEISKLLLSRMKYAGLQIIQLHKTEERFNQLKKLKPQISNSSIKDRISPYVLKYLFQEFDIDEITFIPHTLYFFKDINRIFNIFNNNHSNSSATHLGKCCLINIKNNKQFDDIFKSADKLQSIEDIPRELIEINIYDNSGEITLFNFWDLEFLNPNIVIPSVSENKLLNNYELQYTYLLYIDELFKCLESLRNYLSDYSEGLYNDLDIYDNQCFIAQSKVLSEIDTDTLKLNYASINQDLLYFFPNTENENLHTEEDFTPNYSQEHNNQSKDINMADPISFEFKFDDFTKSDNESMDQKRINSQIENYDIKLHNKNTIHQGNATSADFSKEEPSVNDDESDEVFLMEFLKDKNFEILNFDIDNKEDLPYYDVNLSVRIYREHSDRTQDITPQSAGKIGDNEDPRLFRFLPAKQPEANIVWEGSQFVYHSLALINREISDNIIKSEAAELTIVPYEDDQFFDPDNDKYLKLAQHDIRYKDINKISAEAKKLPYVWIRHQWPPKDVPPTGSKWIIMQPWEMTALPKKFVEIFNQADEVWTPSNFCRKAFVASGVKYNKVQVVPNGVSPELFTPFGDNLPLNTFKRFKFLFVGGTIYRKGIDVLIEAYLSAFTSEDDVCLIIKDMGGDSFYKGQTAKEKIQEIQSDANAPEIIYIDSYLSEDEMQQLYRSADVFVSPYRGEGFSLPTLEAMASGLPVVVTRGGATDDFVDESVGWLINSTNTNIGDVIDNMELTHSAEFLEPNKGHLAEILRYIGTNPKEIFGKGAAAALRAREQWNWRNACIKMYSRLDSLLGTSMAAKAEKNLPIYNDSSLDFARGMQEFNAGNKESALEIWDKITDNYDLPEKYKIHILHIKAYIEINKDNYDEAEKYLDEAVRKIIEHPDNSYLRALKFAKQQQFTEVYEILTTLYDRWAYVRADSTIGLTLDDLLILNAECAYMESDFDAALQLYSEALKYNNENAEACFGAALCLKQAGEKDGAKNMLEWAIKLDPNFNEARKELDNM